ncbi:MAG: hypothetical protein HY830_10380 [Actinobacteria bacterium]|nr:hypothetical protein [Actinomycetota bacterium]
MTTTLRELTARYRLRAAAHLAPETVVPVLDGLQLQGDVAVVPLARRDDLLRRADEALGPLPADGRPVTSDGHPHVVHGTPGVRLATGLGIRDVARLAVPPGETAWLAHPLREPLGIGPGRYAVVLQTVRDPFGPSPEHTVEYDEDDGVLAG